MTRNRTGGTRAGLRAYVALAVMGPLLLFAVWPWLRGHGLPAAQIVFYGFSIAGDAMTQAVFPAFAAAWTAQGGGEVEFISSFAGSGTITNQLCLGVPAQVALLALEADAQRLADAGVIPAQAWRELPHGGVLNRTPLVIVVRRGNPKGIHDFADLARPGVRVIHPDPLTSGAANWAIVAEYGAGLRQSGGDHEAAYRLLLGIWRNVVAQASSARAARTQFENGFGDALVTYEQEVVWDQAQGRLDDEIVHPRSTILSETTLVTVPRHVGASDRARIEAFTRFLWSEAAQRLFVARGFRSVDGRLDAANPALRRIADPFVIQDLGGWAVARREIVDKVWKDRVLAEISR